MLACCFWLVSVGLLFVLVCLVLSRLFVLRLGWLSLMMGG